MTDNSSSNKRIAKNTLFMGLRMVVTLCISLYTTRATLQILGVEDYGVYDVVCGFVSMFIFLNTSMSNGIQRFYNYELGKNGEEGANKVYLTALTIQLLLALIIIVLTESIGLWFLHNKMVIPPDRMVAAEWIFQFSIMSFLLVIMQVPYTAAVMAHEKMDFFALMSVIIAILRLIIVLLLPHLGGDKLMVYGLLILGTTVFAFLSYFLFCKVKFKELYIPKKARIDRKMFKSMLGFSGWNLFGSFSNMMRDQGVNVILNMFFGPIINAARGIAMQVNSAVTQLVTSILIPVRPQVIQSYARGEINRVMSLTYTISKFSLFFLTLMIVPLCVELQFILKIWLGGEIPERTEVFIIIILLTTCVLIPMSSQATLVHASGNMKNYQLIGSTVKILSVPIAYVLMKYGYAPEWSLIMVLLFDVIGLVVGMFIIRTIMPFSILEYTKMVLIPTIPVIIASVLSSWLIHITVQNEIARFLLVCIGSTAVAIVTIYLFCLSKREKELIMGYVNNKVPFLNRKKNG